MFCVAEWIKAFGQMSLKEANAQILLKSSSFKTRIIEAMGIFNAQYVSVPGLQGVNLENPK